MKARQKVLSFIQLIVGVAIAIYGFQALEPLYSEGARVFAWDLAIGLGIVLFPLGILMILSSMNAFLGGMVWGKENRKIVALVYLGIVIILFAVYRVTT